MQIAENKSFVLQTELGNYCRTGKNEPKTSIQEHTFHYRRLVFNVIKDSLKTAYPLARKLIGKKRWKIAVLHFFENHKCQTPQVWKLPLEFFEYYSKNPFPFKKTFPFLKELLHFEWLEIEVFMMEDLPIEAFKKENNSDSEVIIPNPEIKILPLQYPIHTKKIKKITKKNKNQYFVSIHRDFNTKQVICNDLSYPFVEILIKINEEETTKKDIKQIFSKYENDKNRLENIINDFIVFSLHNNLILGYKKQ